MRNLSAFQPNGVKNFELASTSLFSDANLVSYWKFDESSGNAADSKGSNTLTNNNTATFSAAKFNNGANLASASSQQFSIADGSQSGLDFASAVSVSCWINLTSSPGSNVDYAIVSKEASSSSERGYLFMYQNNAGTLRFLTGIGIAGAANMGFKTINYTLTAGQWYHVAFTYLKSSNTAEIFVNGVSIGSGVIDATGTLPDTTSTFRIGARYTTPQGFFNGQIDDVAIFSKALTAGEISQLYYAGSTKAYYPLNGNSNDFSGNLNTGTDTAITYPQGRFGQGAKFNGSSSQIVTASSTGLSLTNNFCISFWLKPSNLTQSNVYLMNQNNQYAVLWEYVDNTVEFFAGGYSGSNPRTASSISMPNTNWNHIVYSYDGTTWSGYRNGVRVFATAITFSLASSANIFTLGSSNGANFFDGMLDEVIIESRAWTAKEVETYYRKSVLNYKPQGRLSSLLEALSNFFFMFFNR